MTTKLLTTTLLASTTLLATAQLRTPQPSPNASVMQQVGITDITVTYSSPGVKGRTIWGELEPYDKFWRAGANASTKITLTTDAKIEGKEINAGTYAIGIMPRQNAPWNVVFAKDGSYGDWKKYDAENDVVRIEVNPIMKENSRERLVYMFNNTTDNSTVLEMVWDKVKIPITITVATDELAMASIRKVIEPGATDLGRAARYCLDNKTNLAEALTWAARADELSERWYFSWLHAALLEANGKYDEALVKAEEAWTLGEQNPDDFFFRDRVKKLIEDLKNRS